MYDPDAMEREDVIQAMKDQERRNRRTGWFIIVGVCGGFWLLVYLLLFSNAEAYQGIGTGFYGDGKVIKEEPPMFQSFDNDSYSVTDDVIDDNGFVSRETTFFDCMDDVLGNRVCRERRW